LSSAPPFIDYHLRRAWHRTPNVLGIASEHHDGPLQARTILDRHPESRFLPEWRNGFRHAQFLGAACGENNRNNLFEFGHAGGCGRINDDDANSQRRWTTRGRHLVSLPDEAPFHLATPIHSK
jgi:hypothetical protein